MRGFLKRFFGETPEQRDKSRREWAFLFNSFGISTLILAIILTFAPYMDGDNPHLPEIKAVERTVQRVLPKKVPGLLISEDGKPVMLVFYASWCTYCAQLMPRILELMDDHQLDKIKPYFVP